MVEVAFSIKRSLGSSEEHRAQYGSFAVLHLENLEKANMQ